MKVRTQASKHFLVWPKQDQMDTETVVKKGQKGKKKVTTMALSLNKLVLQPFVGYTALHRQMGHVDFLYNMFSMLNSYWEVPWLSFTGRAGSKHCDL